MYIYIFHIYFLIVLIPLDVNEQPRKIINPINPYFEFVEISFFKSLILCVNYIFLNFSFTVK